MMPSSDIADTGDVRDPLFLEVEVSAGSCAAVAVGDVVVVAELGFSNAAMFHW